MSYFVLESWHYYLNFRHGFYHGGFHPVAFTAVQEIPQTEPEISGLWLADKAWKAKLKCKSMSQGSNINLSLYDFLQRAAILAMQAKY